MYLKLKNPSLIITSLNKASENDLQEQRHARCFEDELFLSIEGTSRKNVVFIIAP